MIRNDGVDDWVDGDDDDDDRRFLWWYDNDVNLNDDEAKRGLFKKNDDDDVEFFLAATDDNDTDNLDDDDDFGTPSLPIMIGLSKRIPITILLSFVFFCIYQPDQISNELIIHSTHTQKKCECQLPITTYIHDDDSHYQSFVSAISWKNEWRATTTMITMWHKLNMNNNNNNNSTWINVANLNVNQMIYSSISIPIIIIIPLFIHSSIYILFSHNKTRCLVCVLCHPYIK